jgi:superfamily I DNA/RNA helicase
VRAVTLDAGLRRALRERFRYLMVDEFQDTDAMQWSLVLALGREDPLVPEDRLFLVGDPKQAIYSFRTRSGSGPGQAPWPSATANRSCWCLRTTPRP